MFSIVCRTSIMSEPMPGAKRSDLNAQYEVAQSGFCFWSAGAPPAIGSVYTCSFADGGLPSVVSMYSSLPSDDQPIWRRSPFSVPRSSSPTRVGVPTTRRVTSMEVPSVDV